MRTIESLEQELAIAYKNIQHQQEWRDNLSYELNRTKRALWLARAATAYAKANMLRYMWHILVSVKKSNDKELVKIVRRDYDVWCEVQRKCRKYAEKFREA